MIRVDFPGLGELDLDFSWQENAGHQLLHEHLTSEVSNSSTVSTFVQNLFTAQKQLNYGPSICGQPFSPW